MTIAGFTRKAVLDAAKEAVANMESSLAEWEKRAEAMREEHRQKWLAEDLPRLKEFRNKLSAAIKKGGVVPREDFSGLDRLFYRELDDYYVGNRIGHINRQEKRETTEKIIAYQGVIKLLNAQEGGDDDVLSLSMLKSLGINKLGDLFRAAAGKGGTVEKSPI